MCTYYVQFILPKNLVPTYTMKIIIILYVISPKLCVFEKILLQLCVSWLRQSLYDATNIIINVINEHLKVCLNS